MSLKSRVFRRAKIDCHRRAQWRRRRLHAVVTGLCITLTHNSCVGLVGVYKTLPLSIYCVYSDIYTTHIRVYIYTHMCTHSCVDVHPYIYAQVSTTGLLNVELAHVVCNVADLFKPSATVQTTNNPCCALTCTSASLVATSTYTHAVAALKRLCC